MQQVQQAWRAGALPLGGEGRQATARCLPPVEDDAPITSRSHAVTSSACSWMRTCVPALLVLQHLVVSPSAGNENVPRCLSLCSGAPEPMPRRAPLSPRALKEEYISRPTAHIQPC